MRVPTLHYIYDPLCGWCYGAEPLVNAARGIAELELTLHAGGLWPKPTRLPDSMRAYIKEADSRVGQMSGQPYGDAYLDGLLFDPELILDSRPPTAAVLAAQSIDQNSDIRMLQAIQHAHYERGLHVVRAEVLRMLAGELDLPLDSFDQAMTTAPVEAHIAETRSYMARIRARGFPAFALEHDGQWLPVEHQPFASDAPGFREWLSERSVSLHS